MLLRSNFQIVKCGGVIKTGATGVITSRRRTRPTLANPRLEHSSHICLDNGVAKKLEIEHGRLRVLQIMRLY